MISAAGSADARSDDVRAPRPIRVWHFAALVLVYVAAAQGLTLLAARGHPAAHTGMTSVDNAVIRIIIPVGVASMLAMAYVSWCRGWQQVFVSKNRLPRLSLFVPAALVALAAVITNFHGLSEKGFAFTGVFLVGVMMVGFGEELVFRGVGVQAFRQAGFTEAKVAWWTSVSFGISHGSNAVITGEIRDALIQVVLTTGTGFLFYVILRSTGTLTLSMLFHGLWDFSALSTQVDPAQPSSMVNVAAVVLAVLLVGILLMRRRLNLFGPSQKRTDG